jgi:hypothetical protein
VPATVLAALPTLLAFGAATPALAATPAHQEPTEPAAASTYLQVSNTQTCDTDTFCTFTAACPPGTVLTGGGVTTNSFSSSGVYLYESGPISTTTWRATIRNVTAAPFPMTVTAICATSGGGNSPHPPLHGHRK